MMPAPSGAAAGTVIVKSAVAVGVGTTVTERLSITAPLAWKSTAATATLSVAVARTVTLFPAVTVVVPPTTVSVTVGGTRSRIRRLIALLAGLPAVSSARAVRIRGWSVVAVGDTATWKVVATERWGGDTGRVSENVAAPLASSEREAICPLSSAETSTLTVAPGATWASVLGLTMRTVGGVVSPMTSDEEAAGLC